MPNDNVMTDAQEQAKEEAPFDISVGWTNQVAADIIEDYCGRPENELIKALMDKPEIWEAIREGKPIPNEGIIYDERPMGEYRRDFEVSVILTVNQTGVTTARHSIGRNNNYQQFGFVANEECEYHLQNRVTGGRLQEFRGRNQWEDTKEFGQQEYAADMAIRQGAIEALITEVALLKRTCITTSYLTIYKNDDIGSAVDIMRDFIQTQEKTEFLPRPLPQFCKLPSSEVILFLPTSDEQLKLLIIHDLPKQTRNSKWDTVDAANIKYTVTHMIRQMRDLAKQLIPRVERIRRLYKSLQDNFSLHAFPEIQAMPDDEENNIVQAARLRPQAPLEYHPWTHSLVNTFRRTREMHVPAGLNGGIIIIPNGTPMEWMDQRFGKGTYDTISAKKMVSMMKRKEDKSSEKTELARQLQQLVEAAESIFTFSNFVVIELQLAFKMADQNEKIKDAFWRTLGIKALCRDMQENEYAPNKSFAWQHTIQPQVERMSKGIKRKRDDSMEERSLVNECRLDPHAITFIQPEWEDIIGPDRNMEPNLPGCFIWKAEAGQGMLWKKNEGVTKCLAVEAEPHQKRNLFAKGEKIPHARLQHLEIDHDKRKQTLERLAEAQEFEEFAIVSEGIRDMDIDEATPKMSAR